MLRSDWSSDVCSSDLLEIRLTQNESDILEECAKTLNTTKTEVINKGIKLVKSEIEKNK